MPPESASAEAAAAIVMPLLPMLPPPISSGRIIVSMLGEEPLPYC